MNGKKVVVGMSGGVDSSVAAYLLKKEGYDVTGVTMQIWQDGGTAAGRAVARAGDGTCAGEAACSSERVGCCGLSAVEDARRVAQMLDIPYYVMNFKADFQKSVIDYFVIEYLEGRTPNPCIACNRYVKWEALLDRSLAIGADYIATGHYAGVEKLPNGRFAVVRSRHPEKDQSYALYNLTQEQLSRTLLPDGGYSKDEIRAIAAEIGLRVAKKPDSQEICFVPDGDYASFIERETGRIQEEGNFVTADGKVLGRHKGIIRYTIGQRKGLGLSMGRRVVVTEIRPGTNEVVIGEPEDVFSRELTATGLNFMARESFADGMRAVAKIRYNHAGAPCRIYNEGTDRIRVIFDEPVRAVTPGQAVVLYDGGAVLGGGTIAKE